MRKIAILLSGLLIAIFLVACGNQGSNQMADDAPTNSTPSQMESDSLELESSENEAPSSQKQVSSQETVKPESSLPKTSQEENVENIQVTIGDKAFTATLSDNDGADAFAELLRKESLTINMSDYSGFEKVGSLGANLPASNSSITATEGDIILYNGNQICVFYGSNSWSYTRLAKIDDLSGWKEALGSGDITITFSLV